MQKLNDVIRVLTGSEMDMIYESALKVLANAGFKYNSERMQRALKQKGAMLDEATGMMRLPKALIEEVLSIVRKEAALMKGEKEVEKQQNCLAFSWHSGHTDRAPDVKIAMGGGCPQYFDYERQAKRYATHEDFLRMIRLGEAIQEVKAVGNPVHMIIDENGARVDQRMLAIKGAALIAKNSSKPGLSTLLHVDELEFLVEIGTVVKGSFEAYRKRPILININDSETPLQISKKEADIMAALAERGLSVLLLPMPLSGLNVPVTLASGVMVSVAEILAVWAAVKAINENTPVEASVVAGAMDPRTGAASFSTPECALIDIACAQFFRDRIGVRCGVGIGINDASYPGTASGMHRCFKMMAAAACGEVNFPIGILNAGVVFSPEQAMIDLELAHATERFYRGFEVNESTLATDLVCKLGAGALYLGEDHTLAHFRKELWVPDIFTKSKQGELEKELKRDVVQLAYEKWTALLQVQKPYYVGEEKAREIDRIVTRAEKKLMQRQE